MDQHRLSRILRIYLKKTQKFIKKFYKHMIFFFIIILIIYFYYISLQERVENVKYKKWYKSWNEINKNKRIDNKTK